MVDTKFYPEQVQEKSEKIINIPIKLLKCLWDKLTDDVFDRSFDGDFWQSEELLELVREIEKILEDNNSDVL